MTLLRCVPKLDSVNSKYLLSVFNIRWPTRIKWYSSWQRLEFWNATLKAILSNSSPSTGVLLRSRLSLLDWDWTECFIIQARNYANGSRRVHPSETSQRCSKLLFATRFVHVSRGPISERRGAARQQPAVSGFQLPWVDIGSDGGRKRYGERERLIIVRSVVVA